MAESSFGNGTTFVAFALDNASRCIVQGSNRYNTGVGAVLLTGGSNRNSIDVTHAPRPGQTVSDVLISSSAVLANRIVGNGAPLATRQEWAASTAYVKGQELTRLGFVYRVTADHTSGSSFGLANLALLSAPLAGTSIPTGKYVFAGGGQGPLTGSLGNGTLRVFPVYIPHDVTLTRIGADIATAGEAGSKFRLVIYADTGSMEPGSLVLDAGQIAGDSATVQEIVISQTLTAGVYWVGGVAQSAPTTQPVVRTWTPGSYALPLSSAPGASAGVAGYTHSSTVSAAAPATFSIGATVGSIPRIHIKG